MVEESSPPATPEILKDKNTSFEYIRIK